MPTSLNPKHVWQRLPFNIAVVACLQFIVLTALAMLIYPGGSSADKTTSHYKFFENFFSDLGRTITSGGHPNPIASVLFFIALSVAGLSLVLFFIAAPQYFLSSRAGFILSLLGSAFGVVTGVSYVGVACTPANLSRGMHLIFVLTAFRSFLGVAALYTLAIFLTKGYPKAYAAIYLIFTALLAGYIALITRGPDLNTLEGLIIQATGQKIIVYAAIGCVLFQSVGILRRVKKSDLEGAASR